MRIKSNRIISAALALFLTIGALTASLTVFADSEPATDEVFAAQKKLLEDLGILKINIENPDESVSRAQFADMAMRSYLETLPSVEKTEVFSDVIPNYEYKDAIEAAFKHGIIKGDGTGTFGVNESVTPQAAVTIMLRVLGYEDYIKWQGSFEEKYIAVASKIGLLKNIEMSKDKMTFKEAVQLMYNAIEIAPLNLSAVESGSAYYDKDKNTTLISDRLEIYEKYGVVTDNSYTSLNGSMILDNGYVKIGRTVYKTGNSDAADFIGYNVHVYYKLYDGDSVPTILHIEDNSSSVTVVNDEAYNGFSDGVLSYINENGSKRSVRIGKTAVVVYNGSLVRDGQYSNDLFDIDNGSITVIEKSMDGLTIVLIRQYNDLAFDRFVDAQDYYMLIDKYNPENNVRIDDLDMFDVRDSSGKKMEASEIAADSTVSAAISLDGKCGYLKVSTNTLRQAFVTSSTEKGVTLKTYNESAHTYDELEYKYSEKFKKLNKEQDIVTAKSEYTVYINVSGNVAYMALEKDMSDFYAYIIDCAAENKAFDDKLKLKVFKDDGKTGVYDVADTVKIDGVKYSNKSASELKTLLGLDSDLRSRLVYMSLSYNSEVRSVDTCPDETEEREADYSLYKSDREAEDTLYKIDGRQAMYTTTLPNRKYYASDTKTFDTGIFISSNTKIMAIPRDSDDEDRFKILTSASFVNGKYYMVKAYGRDDDTLAPDIILFFYFSRYSSNKDEAEVNGTTQFARVPFYATYDTDAAFVNRISKGTDPDTGEDKDIVNLTVLRTGAQAVHYVDDPSLTEGISQGDVVRWYTVGGSLCYLEKLYTMESKEFNPNPRPIKWQNGSVVVPSYFLMHDNTFLADSYSTQESEAPVFAVAHGVILEKNASQLSYITYDNYLNGNTGQKHWKINDCSTAKIYKYDKKNNLLEKTTFNDLISYSDSNIENSEAVIITKNMRVLAVIIY